MAIKVLITRRFREGKAMELLGLLNKIRVEAMNQPGYITGETLIGYDDRQKLVVIGTWESVDHWEKWKSNAVRTELEAQLEPLLVEPPQYEAFLFGTFPLRK